MKKKGEIKEIVDPVDIDDMVRADGVRVTEELIVTWGKLSLDLKYWKSQLRLDDVDIELRWMMWDEDSNMLATCEDFSPSHMFIVSIRQPQHKCSVDMARNFNTDYEVILVHELLHVRNHRWNCGEIRSILDKGVNHDIYEVSLDATAEALVRVRRGLTR